jgi:hypothetical protein
MTTSYFVNGMLSVIYADVSYADTPALTAACLFE